MKNIVAKLSKFTLNSSDFRRISNTEFQATEAISRFLAGKRQQKVTRVSLVEEEDIMSLMRPIILKLVQ
jgi:hypothetical protein